MIDQNLVEILAAAEATALAKTDLLYLVNDPSGTPVDKAITVENALKAAPIFGFAAATELTIASGVITATQNWHTVDTQGNAASDDLDTINGGAEGMLLFLRPESDSRTVVVKHNTGNIITVSGVDITLDDSTDFVVMIFDAGLNKWLASYPQPPAASTTVPGIVELATAAETTTGTSATLAVTPDGLAGSVYGKRVVEIMILDTTTSLVVKDGIGDLVFIVPSELNGYNLVGAHAAVTTVSSSGTPTIQIHNVTDSVDMLSTRITIDANEYTSYTAATAPVIDTTKDDVATGDRLRFDCDVTGTGTKGLIVILTFQLP